MPDFARSDLEQHLTKSTWNTIFPPVLFVGFIIVFLCCIAMVFPLMDCLLNRTPTAKKRKPKRRLVIRNVRRLVSAANGPWLGGDITRMQQTQEDDDEDEEENVPGHAFRNGENVGRDHQWKRAFTRAEMV